MYNGDKLTYFTVSKTDSKIYGVTREHHPHNFMPVSPLRSQRPPMVFFLTSCTVWILASERLVYDSNYAVKRNSVAVKTTARVLTMPMMTTLCLSVKAVGQLDY